jgi:hypothetical protein
MPTKTIAQVVVPKGCNRNDTVSANAEARTATA